MPPVSASSISFRRRRGGQYRRCLASGGRRGRWRQLRAEPQCRHDGCYDTVHDRRADVVQGGTVALDLPPLFLAVWANSPSPVVQTELGVTGIGAGGETLTGTISVLAEANTSGANTY